MLPFTIFFNEKTAKSCSLPTATDFTATAKACPVGNSLMPTALSSKEDRIISLYEDSHANCWIGTQTGVGVLLPDGNGFTLNDLIVGDQNLSQCYVKDILEDPNHNIWLATINYGLIRLTGDFCLDAAHHLQKLLLRKAKHFNQQCALPSSR